MAIDTGLQGKPWYFGFGIGAVVALVILAAVHYLLITGINERIASNQGQLDELQKKVEAGRAAQRDLPKFRDEVKSLETELEKLRRILPSSRNTEDIIRKIKALVDQGNFVLTSISFPPLGSAAGGEVYAEWPIKISVEGGYHDLAILFNRLSNFSRIMNVEQFEITSLQPQTERTIRSDFTAKTFVYVEPQAAEPAKDGVPGGEAPAGGVK